MSETRVQETGSSPIRCGRTVRGHARADRLLIRPASERQDGAGDPDRHIKPKAPAKAGPESQSSHAESHQHQPERPPEQASGYSQKAVPLLSAASDRDSRESFQAWPRRSRRRRCGPRTLVLQRFRWLREGLKAVPKGPAYRSAAFARFIASRRELEHIRTRHKSPRTNGVRERGFGTLKYEQLYCHDISDGEMLARPRRDPTPDLQHPTTPRDIRLEVPARRLPDSDPQL